MKRAVLMFLFCCMAFTAMKVSAFEPPVQGSVPISTREDLEAMRNIDQRTNVNGNFHLVNDIDLSGGAWEPLIGAGSTFTGTFDGQGFVIRNMSITRGNANNNAGFFAEICNNSVVKNVGFENIDITTNIESGSTVSVGGIVGVNNGTISNSYVTGNINGTATQINVFVGGIVGSNNGSVSDCYSMADVIVSSRNSGTIGGVVGENNGSVRRVYSAGNINARRGSAIGGVVGSNRDSGSVLNTFWNMEATHERNGNLIPVSDRRGIGSGNGEAEGLSLGQMRTASSFESWDFQIWQLIPDVNNDFPVLRGFTHIPVPQTPQHTFVLPPLGPDVNVVINEEIHVFEVPPQIINGRTMLPLRAIGEALGMMVGFDTATSTAFLTTPNMVITHIVGTNSVTVNNEIRTFDASSVIYEGRTLVPVRMLAEAIDAEVDWDAPTRTVIITYSTE